MTAKQYANKVRSAVGAIRALLSVTPENIEDCRAIVPLHNKVFSHLADCQEAGADFWGNGGMAELADMVCAKMVATKALTERESITSAARARVERNQPVILAWFVSSMQISPVFRMTVYTAITSIAVVIVPSCRNQDMQTLIERSVKSAVNMERVIAEQQRLATNANKPAVTP